MASKEKERGEMKKKKYCHTCGGENRPAAKFCGQCGVGLYRKGGAGYLHGHEGHSFASPVLHPFFCTQCGKKMPVEVKK